MKLPRESQKQKSRMARIAEQRAHAEYLGRLEAQLHVLGIDPELCLLTALLGERALLEYLRQKGKLRSGDSLRATWDVPPGDPDLKGPPWGLERLSDLEILTMIQDYPECLFSPRILNYLCRLQGIAVHLPEYLGYSSRENQKERDESAGKEAAARVPVSPDRDFVYGVGSNALPRVKYTKKLGSLPLPLTLSREEIEELERRLLELRRDRRGHISQELIDSLPLGVPLPDRISSPEKEGVPAADECRRKLKALGQAIGNPRLGLVLLPQVQRLAIEAARRAKHRLMGSGATAQEAERTIARAAKVSRETLRKDLRQLIPEQNRRRGRPRKPHQKDMG